MYIQRRLRTADLQIKAELKNGNGGLKMNLKEIFDNAENGTLTYEQFMSAATTGKAKFVDLSEGNYVDKQKYTDELAARDTRITTLDDTIKTRDTDLANLRQQLVDAGDDSTKLSEVTTKFTDLQKQYDKDTKAYQKQLKDQAYSFAVKTFTGEQEFTSAAAKREFERSMIARGLQMDGDTIIGATDFLNAYKQDNADSFKVETQTNNEPAKPTPHFVSPTQQNSNNGDDANAFHFNFVGVRPHEK